jgi:hypothetical protein
MTEADDAKADADGESAPPNPAEPERASKPTGRSNEFYLALAGIAATVIVGLVGALLAYQATGRQIAAESERAALSFSRDQRKEAYTEFLNALFDLDRTEFNIKNAYDTTIGGAQGPSALENQYKAYTEATDRLNRAVSTVELLASNDVASARAAIRDEHSAIYGQIDALMASAKRGASPAILDQLRQQVGVATPDLEQRFVDAAKKDLGITD